MSEPIFGHLEHAWRTAEGDISHLFHHGRYHQPNPGATVPDDQENPMSLIAELKTEALNLAAKFGQVDEAAADKLAALEGNPVADALLEALHVPAEDLAPVVSMLKTLGALVPKPEPAAAEAEPQPA